MNESLLLNAKDIDRILTRMAHEITEKSSFNPDKTALIGIRTRGIYLAERLKKKIHAIENHLLDLGSLDISFHRDDLDQRTSLPVVGVTEITFNITGREIILVDDVLYTGRTVRAALDELMDFGRPDRILLAVLIDRGHRELPIRPDFVGKNIPTHEQDSIRLHLSESDGKDEVILQCP
ncbi:MAG: bifunctional pyr operon transcriptional regulator/uracil phosphoribosyltransferase PyrR [Candidatus Aureabacteria bacterium]|nr:bifunctional pyr operon transcriptional regulator/uracil phosphoribosyltransferase PyrR [Candidatus Auribacterota bacterium]